MAYRYPLLLLLLMVLCSACGYRFSSEEEVAVSVPFIAGERTGALTTAIVKELCESHPLTYGGSDAPYELELGIRRHDKDIIGWQYQTFDSTGLPKDKLAPVESRQTMVVTVTIKHRTTGEVIAGPIDVDEFVDYDYSDNRSFHDLGFVRPNGQIGTYLDLSIGQLDAEEDATSIARKRLYQELAKKIVKAANFAVVIDHANQGKSVEENIPSPKESTS